MLDAKLSQSFWLSSRNISVNVPVAYAVKNIQLELSETLNLLTKFAVIL